MAVESLNNMNVAIAEEIISPNEMVENSLAMEMSRVDPLMANPETAGQITNFISVTNLLETVRDSARRMAREILFLSGEMSQAERWNRPEMVI